MPLLDNSRFRKIIPLLLALLCITACSSEKPEKLAATPPPAGPAVSLPAVKLEAFGALPPAVQETVTPAFKEPAATVDRAVNVKQVMDFLGVRLTPAQKKFIQDHKFLLIPKSATKFKDKVDLSGESEDPFDEMLGLFDYLSGSGDPMNRKPENCRFVNPDVMLQAFHKYFENSLEYLEKTELAGTLRRFLTAMQAKALEYKADSKAPLAEHYELIAAQLTVPLVILENARWPNPEEKIPTSPLPTPPPADDRDTLENALKILGKDKDKFSEPVFNRMVAELQLIFGARDQAPSPLFGQYAKEEGAKADYTQFTPRSHYVKNSLLRSYFRAMIYLGRNGYLLGNPAGITDAMLAAIVMASPGPAGSPPPLQDWQRIMELTGFYAGQPDDIGYPQWRDFLVKVLGAGKISSGEAVNPEILEKISRNLGELQKPRIFSEVVVSPEVLTSNKEQLLEKSKSFRIFGQRFTLDAWVLNRLTAGQEKTPLRLPSMPTALFVPAVLGDQAALRFADQYLRKLTPPFTPDETYQFEGRMNEVAADLTRVTDSEWFSSLSSAWLKLLGTLTSPYGRGYPLYMQDRLFPVKQVESFLGSYAELKHDTVLYAKQSYAERGGGGDEGTPPPVPKGFVEPNLAFWQTLARLVDYVDSGFARYGIFKNEREEYGRLKRFKESVAFYTKLAAQELRGEPLTEAEYEKLRTSELMYMAAPFEMGMVLQEKDMRSALIADIHTDTVAQQILYEAVGEPYVMLVLVGNDDSVRLAVGVAFNHYELTGPLATRYTDADWQNRVYEHEPPLPPKNFWYQGLMTK
jgi:hypothetical protein